MIEAKNLVKKYGSLTAVDDLSLSIREGETLGLLGPNGAGKTTTISMLVGLTTPDAGSVSICSLEKANGKPTAGSPEDSSIRRMIGVAPQSLSLYEELTATENLGFFATLYDLSGQELKDRIESALEIAGLSDRRNDRVKTFSGGMKRRLNIAVALIHNPKIVLLDEPTVGVDPQSRNHIFERIEKMQRAGMTILYTTHYMEEAQRLCDRVAIMDQGKILAIDTVDGLLQSHGGRATVTAKLHPDSSRVDLPAEPVDGTISFESDDPVSEVAKLAQTGVRFQNLNIVNADLETVFLGLTGKTLRDSQ